MQLINPYKMFQGVFIPNVLLKFKGISQSAKLMWGRLAQYAGEDGKCYPDFSELSEEIGLSESGARKVLRELREAGFIWIKYPKGKERLMHRRCEYFFINHEIFREGYMVRAGVSENGYSGISGDGECKECPKTESATEENHRRESLITLVPDDEPSGGESEKPKKYHGSDEDHALAHQIYDAVLVVNATIQEPKFDRWANEIRLMREQDGRTHEDIWRVFLYANRDQFWCHNVLSPGAIRRHYAKLAPRAGMLKSQVRGVTADVTEVDATKTCGQCAFAGKGKKICGGADGDPGHQACELFRPAKK